MKRWLVELAGESADLEEFPRWFPDGEAHAIAEGVNVFLTGAAFDRFDTPNEVIEAAEQVLDEFVAVIMLLWPSLHPPTLGAVWLEDESGHRRHHIFASIHEEMRVKDYPEATINSMGSTEQGPTEAQQLLAAFRLATNAQAAMMIWADPHRTWPRLYRILEELEVELKMHVDKACLCSKDERSRFTNSANSAEVAGKDSRHRAGKYDPPKRPMSLHEATSFIGGLIQGTMHLIHSAAQTR